jgi:Uma2 family endonuclease
MSEVRLRPNFDPTHNYRVADLAVTCEPHDPDEVAIRAPVLVVEILSPSDEAEQRAKLHVYAAMPSVQEILLIDSRMVRAEVHRRGPGGSWPDAPEAVVGGETLRLDSVGLSVPLAACCPGLNLPPGER